MTLPPDQGRARGLYDEQAQRVQQEKLLCAGRKPFLLTPVEDASVAAPQSKTSA